MAATGAREKRMLKEVEWVLEKELLDRMRNEEIVESDLARYIEVAVPIDLREWSSRITKIPAANSPRVHGHIWNDDSNTRVPIHWAGRSSNNGFSSLRRYPAQVSGGSLMRFPKGWTFHLKIHGWGIREQCVGLNKGSIVRKRYIWLVWCWPQTLDRAQVRHIRMTANGV